MDLTNIQAYWKQLLEKPKDRFSQYTRGILLTLADEEMKCKREDVDKKTSNLSSEHDHS